MVGVERRYPPKPSKFLTEEDVERIYHLIHGEDPPFLSYFQSYLDAASFKDGRIHRAKRGYNQLWAKSNGAERTVRLRTFFKLELDKMGLWQALLPTLPHH